jgi:hypothetical protein
LVIFNEKKDSSQIYFGFFPAIPEMASPKYYAYQAQLNHVMWIMDKVPGLPERLTHDPADGATVWRTEELDDTEIDLFLTDLRDADWANQEAYYTCPGSDEVPHICIDLAEITLAAPPTPHKNRSGNSASSHNGSAVGRGGGGGGDERKRFLLAATTPRLNPSGARQENRLGMPRTPLPSPASTRSARPSPGPLSSPNRPTRNASFALRRFAAD